MNKEELELLAAAIYGEVCQVWNRYTGGNSQTICPFAEQGEAVRQAYIRGAATANTLVTNSLIRRSREDTP